MDGNSQRKAKGARAYQTKDLAERNALIQRYAHLVKRVALHIKARLPPQVDLDDLVQSGMVGLMDAIQNYRPENIASFEGYAMIRIRGSIIDHMRMYDWTPRSVHQNTRAMRAVKAKLQQTLGRKPTPSEMAEEMGVDVGQYQQMVLDTAQSQLRCLGETNLTEEMISELPEVDLITGQPSKADFIFNSIASVELRRDLASSIQALPDREKQIVSLYYDQEMNLREVGMIMKISESRACQLLATALEHLRERLADDWDKTGSGNKKYLPECIGLAPSHPEKSYDKLIVEGAKPIPRAPQANSLFADIEAEQASQVSQRVQENQKRVARKSAALAGVDYDNERFFNSFNDELYKDTLSQRFNNDELPLPEVDCEASADLPINTELRIPAFIHSTRPRLSFKDLDQARMTANQW